MNSDDKQTRRFGRFMVFSAWILMAMMLTVLFSKILSRQQNPNQSVQTTIASDGSREVVLERNRSGHYLANGTINGLSVEFLLDTGATNISVPQRIANRLGLRRGPAVRTRTASGVVITYATRLDSVTLGEVSASGVAANINPHMPGDQILLGMSFLRRFDLLQQGDRLTIRSPARRSR